MCFPGPAPAEDVIRDNTGPGVSLAGTDGERIRTAASGEEGRALAHQLAELLEQVAAVVRPRGGLGVILHAEQRVAAVPHPLERLVVQVDVGRLQVARQRLGAYREAVV